MMGPAMAQPVYPNWAAWASLRTPALLRSLTRPIQTSSRHTFRHPTSPSTRSLRTLTLTLMTRTPLTLCTPSLSHSTRAGPASGRVRRAACCTSTAGYRISCAESTAEKCYFPRDTALRLDSRIQSLSTEYLTL